MSRRQLKDARDTEFTEFCEDLYPRLVGALTLHVGERSTAEDLAREALVRAWERWRRVRTMDRADGWVFRVAFNLAASRGRRWSAERRAVKLPNDATANTCQPTIGYALTVREALSELTPRQRAAVVLRYYVDLNVQETAEVLGCALGTVRSLASQGTARLRSHLGEEEPTEEGVDCV